MSILDQELCRPKPTILVTYELELNLGGTQSPILHVWTLWVDLGEPTHTLVPCWMPKALPPMSKCTGCFAATLWALLPQVALSLKITMAEARDHLMVKTLETHPKAGLAIKLLGHIPSNGPLYKMKGCGI